MKKVVAILIAALTALTAFGAEQEELIWQDGQWVRQAAPALGTPEGQVSLIRRYLDQEKYGQATDLAKAFTKKYPGNPLRERVYDLAGQAEMRRGLYWQAYEYYDRLLKEYPSGSMVNRAVDREMEIAKAFLAGKKRRVWGIFWLSAQDEGIEILQKIPNFVPGTVRAENALLTVGDWYYEKARYREAADGYDAYIRVFPYASRAAYAEFRAADSLFKAYRGPSFDDTTLVESEQRFKAFAEHRPAAAAESHVSNLLKNIHEQRAEKQYIVAEFYKRTAHPEAAVYYYKYVAQEFGDTNWGKQARQDVNTMKYYGAGAKPGRKAAFESTTQSSQPTSRRAAVTAPAVPVPPAVPEEEVLPTAPPEVPADALTPAASQSAAPAEPAPVPADPAVVPPATEPATPVEGDSTTAPAASAPAADPAPEEPVVAPATTQPTIAAPAATQPASQAPAQEESQ